MIVTPVQSSPASIARWIGAAPRQRGSNEAWMLRHPRRGQARTAGGRISPYAATTSTSSAQASASPRPSGVFRVAGCTTGNPLATA